MVNRILDTNQERLLEEERRRLRELQAVLAKFDSRAEDRKTLETSLQQLDKLFLLVIVGEFNAGKSAFINALLGQGVLEEGVTPTTTRIQVLAYGPDVQETLQDAGCALVSAPIELLREINIVDTPGTNAIHREHEALTREFVPRSDMVLFITSADRPFTESERQFLERIRDWGKKVVLVVNKIDILETVDEIAKVETFVAEHATRLLGFTPQVFPISSRQALRAKSTGDAVLQAASRFAALERYVNDTLDEKERIRLKLRNPLGVGLRLIEQTQAMIEARLELLRDDIQTLDNIEGQMHIYQEDTRRDFRFRMADVDNVLQEFENRGMAFFDETLRLARVFDLLNKARLKSDFEEQIVQDVPRTLEARIADIIDWLAASNLRQWQDVMGHINQRRTIHAERIVGHVGSNFEYDRDRLLATVGRAGQLAIDTYDESAEANKMAISLQLAVAETAIMEISAIGLGALLTTLFTTTVLDVTGIVAAGTVAALGLFVIPTRRRKIKQELRERITLMREQLTQSLTGQFERELQHSQRSIEAAIAPYTRFVRAERDRLTETHDALEQIQEALARLAAEIERL
ncbi:MAG: dynamin family protein [Anaerolineae bacterium]|nr:dynamin family protein [Anaerolineae bacterium]